MNCGLPAHSPNAQLCRLQPIIDLYIAPLIQLDASILKSHTPCVRGASGGDEDMAFLNRALPSVVADLHLDAFTGNAAHLPHLRPEQHLNAFVAEEFKKGFRVS